MSTIYDDRVIAASLRNWSEQDLWAKYREWNTHCLRMERPNDYQYLESSYAYAKLRREDFRQELRRRGLA